MSVAKWRTALGKALLPVERKWLKDMAQRMESVYTKPVIVNIGIFRGASMYCLRAGAPNAILYGIDIEYPQGAKLHPSVEAHLIISDSSKYHILFNSSIHLLFVDGNHSYKGVSADIAGWVRKIVPGGVAAFHDFKTERKVAAKHAGIKRAVLEWSRGSDWIQLKDVGSLRAYRRPIQ